MVRREASTKAFLRGVEKARFFLGGQAEKVLPFWFPAQSECLDRALALWKEVLTKGPAPAVRSLQQTAASLQILVALYQLVAKVLAWLSLWHRLKLEPRPLPLPSALVEKPCTLSIRTGLGVVPAWGTAPADIFKRGC